jgi:hypothetical protein
MGVEMRNTWEGEKTAAGGVERGKKEREKRRRGEERREKEKEKKELLTSTWVLSNPIQSSPIGAIYLVICLFIAWRHLLSYIKSILFSFSISTGADWLFRTRCLLFFFGWIF